MKLSEVMSFFPHPGEENSEEFISHFFQTGLEEILTTLIAIVVCGLHAQGGLPRGISGQFSRAFTKTSLGNLRNFLLWLIKNHQNTELSPDMVQHFEKREKGDTGWFNKMIALRNQWAHANITGEFIDQAQDLLAKAPDMDHWGNVQTKQEDILIWSNNGGFWSLYPLLFFKDRQLDYPREFKTWDHMQFKSKIARDAEFRPWWRNVRIQDSALDNCTADDFIGKARLTLPSDYTERAPDFVGQLFRAKSPGVIFQPPLLSGLINAVARQRTDSGIFYAGDCQNDIDEVFKQKLGLARSPSIDTICGWTSRDRPVVMGFGTERLDSYAFLQMIYWLLDIVENGGCNGLYVVFERSIIKLKQDQESIWDRLPNNLDDIFTPPKQSAVLLPDYVWPKQHRVGFLDAIKKVLQ